MLKKENGITLVALVITIIVLLILAGITLALVLGDNGIFTKANNAKIATEVSSAKDAVSLAIMDAITDQYSDTDGSIVTANQLTGTLATDVTKINAKLSEYVINTDGKIAKGSSYSADTAVKDANGEILTLSYSIPSGKTSISYSFENDAITPSTGD